MPILKEPIFAVAAGEIHPRWFDAGEEVTGNVAEAAKKQGKLMPEKKTKARKAAPENK